MRKGKCHLLLRWPDWTSSDFWHLSFPTWFSHLWWFSFVFFFFPSFIFWSHCVACRMSVPQPGIDPGPWQWKFLVLTVRPPGNSVFCHYCLKIVRHTVLHDDVSDLYIGLRTFVIIYLCLPKGCSNALLSLRGQSPGTRKSELKVIILSVKDLGSSLLFTVDSLSFLWCQEPYVSPPIILHYFPI